MKDKDSQMIYETYESLYEKDVITSQLDGCPVMGGLLVRDVCEKFRSYGFVTPSPEEEKMCQADLKDLGHEFDADDLHYTILLTFPIVYKERRYYLWADYRVTSNHKAVYNLDLCAKLPHMYHGNIGDHRYVFYKVETKLDTIERVSVPYLQNLLKLSKHKIDPDDISTIMNL